MFDRMTPLAFGSPRFADPYLAAIAERDDPIAAWAAALARDGERALREVHGDFAIAMPMADGRVVLAVDRFATHSMCYRWVNGQLRFAARADELAALAPAAAIDPQAIFDYLFFHVIPSPRTIFKEVFRLPAGHCAVLAQGQLQVSAYWVPEFNEPRSGDFKALSAEFRQLLKDAVASQLDGSKPACFLSGGTNSSTVAGMVGLASGRAAASYSIGFEAEGYDEMEFARLASRRFGTEHHEYYVTPDDLVRSMGSVAAHYDQPFGNSSVLPAYYCAKMAREDGVTKLLAGDGGDELFGGNARYAKQRVFGYYEHVPGFLRSGVLEPLLTSRAAQGLGLLRKGGSYVEQARVPMPDRLQMYNMLCRLGPEHVFTAGFMQQVNPQAPAEHQLDVWRQPKATEWVNRTLAFDWRYTLAEADLPKVCGSTQLAGVAVGFPLLDQRLLDFSMRLPADYKLKGLKLRWFFKEALRGFLPDEILTKKKQGFGLPFGMWATRHAGLHQLASDALGSLSARGVIQPAFIRSLLDKHLPEFPGYYGEMVWILAMLELWLQKHAPSWRLEQSS